MATDHPCGNGHTSAINDIEGGRVPGKPSSFSSLPGATTIFPSPFWLPRLESSSLEVCSPLGFHLSNPEFLGVEGNILSSHLPQGFLYICFICMRVCLAPVSSWVLRKSCFPAGCRRLNERTVGYQGGRNHTQCTQCGVHWASSGHHPSSANGKYE